MKKLKLSLVLVLALAAMLVLSACTGMMAQTCTVHRDLNKDTTCDVCGSYVPVNCTNHLDENHDGACDTNGCTMMLTPSHFDGNCDGKCDAEACGKKMKIKHEDADVNGFCDKCNYDLTADCEHEDEDEDGTCDLCNKVLDVCEHVDEEADGTCDLCGREVEVVVCNHTDANFDGKCDKCKNAISGAIALISTGKFNYQFVLKQGAPTSHAAALDSLIGELNKAGYDVKDRVSDNTSNIADYEILIGNCKSRGEEYQLDQHVYGPKGYAIQIIGTKIVVAYGSDDAYADALAALKTEIIGLVEGSAKPRNRYITAKNSISVIQDDYKVSTLTLNGVDMKGFTIAVDKTNDTLVAVATELQTKLYGDTGYWFEIVSLDEMDKSIVISLVERSDDPEHRYDNPGFKVTCTDNRITFTSEYITAYQTVKYEDIPSGSGTITIEKGSLLLEYFTRKILMASSDAIDFQKKASDSAPDDDFNYEKDIRYVYYKDFGAISDDDEDDSEAMRAAHKYANLGGHKVIAEAGAFYDIKLMTSSITVKTDVDWKDATFYLHDYLIAPKDEYSSKAYYRSVMIFNVAREESAVTVPGLKDKIAEINAAGGIDASTFTSFGVNFGRRMLVRVSNSNHQNYIRYGVNSSDGGSQAEIILVDKNGNVDPTTPFMFDYSYITSYYCYPVDDTPVTVEGGIFRTSPYMTDTPQAYNAYERGIQCGRSNTTFKNIKHILENEGNYNYDAHKADDKDSTNTTDFGCPYGGFYSTTLCNNVRYVGCQASAHITYKGSNGAGMGTYDVSPGNSTNIVYEECYQSVENYYNKTYVKDDSGEPTTKSQGRWGVMGSSGNKNVTFLNSKLTRMDAHGGIHNVYIIGSELKMIRVDGTGIFYMEDSVMHGSTFFGLREDYGGFWNGNLIFKNVKVVDASTVNFITNTWYNHYFGYPTAYPTNILIDNLQCGSFSGADFAIDESAVFTPYANPTVRIFGAETSSGALSGILAGAHKTMFDYLPATSNNSVSFDPDLNMTTEQKYYPNGAPVVVPNKNQTPAPERLIIRNCDSSINFVIPDKEKYPWFANMVVSYNETTECEQHFDCFGEGDNLCDDCGAEMPVCTEHFDGNNDGYCAICYADVPIKCDKHIDKEINFICDICHVHVECLLHVDADENTICDLCGGVLGCPGKNHIDLDDDGKGNGYCDLCTKLIPKCETCVDEKNENKQAIRDGKCDTCKADMVDVITPCDECVDTDGNDVCDRCYKDMAPAAAPCEHEDVLGTHVDEGEDGICDNCEAEMSSEATCTKATDGKCDKCGEDMPAAPCEHVDEDPADNKCDKCNEDMPALLPCEHTDEDPADGKCDKCDEDMPADE